MLVLTVVAKLVGVNVVLRDVLALTVVATVVGVGLKDVLHEPKQLIYT